MFRVTAPSRLHFGLLARGPNAPRQFGGLGLMVDSPGLKIEAEPSEDWSADGPLADRVLKVAKSVAAELLSLGKSVPTLRFRVHSAPPQHVGLGTGTQLSLAVAQLVAESIGLFGGDATFLAKICGRGLRSGVGLHGYDVGGLVVEGGHKANGGIAPLLCQAVLPRDWRVLVVVPPSTEGLHGPEELRAFASLPPMPDSETDRLCRLVLLGILPSLAERDLTGFGESLEEIQYRVGSWFAPAQGGLFASRKAEEMVSWLRSEGVKGVGQSSWGPTLYGFTDQDEDWRLSLLDRLRERFNLAQAGLWTVASEGGAVRF